MSREIEKHYQLQGKEITDEFFNAKIFHERLTRDDLMCVENCIAFYLQLNAEAVAKVTALTERIKNRK